jgi:LacI family repressor for deo operon, udp, cdd, tsx, nupC, and nupG
MDITKIARLTGVSIATVSRALNHPEMVHPKTREKVLKVVEEMEYQPNPHAQALLTGNSNTIALVIPTLKNPYFAQIAEGCENTISERGFNLIIYSTEESHEKEARVISELRRRRVDAAILAGSGLFGTGHDRLFSSVDMPMVLIENIRGQEKHSAVYFDDFAAVRLICDYLTSLGHVSIGLIAGDSGLPTTERKLQWFKEMLYTYGIKTKRSCIVYGQYHLIESGNTAMHQLLSLKEKPSAVFAFNDILAIGAIAAAKEKGLLVPDDISIIGMDDIPISQYTSPSLTTIRSPSYQMGSISANLAIDKAIDPETPPKRVVLPVELIMRDSCTALH